MPASSFRFASAVLPTLLIGGIAFVACNAATGVDDYQFSTSASGAATTAGSGGAASSSASTTTTSTSTSQGGASTSSGSGGTSTGSGGCSGGMLDCGGATCTNGIVDPLNCGACGHTCMDTEVCSNSTCKCRYGLTRVGGSCLALGSDPNNCGAQGTVCSGSTPVCLSGNCAATCGIDKQNCNNACVDPEADPLHCGCMQACAVGKLCVNSQCVDYEPAPCSTCPCATCAAGESCCQGGGWPLCVQTGCPGSG